MIEPWRLTASQASALMKKGNLTVEEYAKSLLIRIKERDHVVKAWAYLNEELILAEAKKLDQIQGAHLVDLLLGQEPLLVTFKYLLPWAARLEEVFSVLHHSTVSMA